MTEKLGPCPLCGGEAKDNSGTVSIRHVVWCPTCEGPRMDMQWWNRLSAIAASERRMRAALERIANTCRMFDGCPVGPDTIAEVCDEALKGGKG